MIARAIQQIRKWHSSKVKVKPFVLHLSKYPVTIVKMACLRICMTMGVQTGKKKYKTKNKIENLVLLYFIYSLI